VERVQTWREKHPGYWRKQGAETVAEQGRALQDLLPLQPIDDEAVNVFRNQLKAEISGPLQDVLEAQQYALVGLTCMISGDGLQEDIAQVLATCYERGQRIGGVAPWMNQQGVGDEGARTDHAAAAAAHSAAVQLGRSPPGP